MAIVPLEEWMHEYLSTACLHGEHGYCQSSTGLAGAKRPARCKWCDVRCICSCHSGPAQADQEQPEPSGSAGLTAPAEREGGH